MRMSRFLYLIRHAQAESVQFAESDRERVLKQEGQREAKALGHFLASKFSNPNLIITSPATRTRTTSALIAAGVGYDPENILFNEQVYSGKKDDLMALVSKIDNSIDHLMIVGHYPTIVEFHDFISDQSRYSMLPAELLVVKFENAWSEITKGCGTTVLQHHPASS